MEHVWAPWRIEYIERPKGGGCIFCDHLAANDDRAARILHRGRDGFLLLNRYPYNPGHIMVAPYRHTGRLDDLPPQSGIEMLELVSLAMKALRESMRPDGFNLGANLGAAAGAGVRDHLHLHVVPRWEGDTNFMRVLADTSVMPEHLDRTYDKLLAALEHLGSQTSPRP